MWVPEPDLAARGDDKVFRLRLGLLIHFFFLVLFRMPFCQVMAVPLVHLSFGYDVFLPYARHGRLTASILARCSLNSKKMFTPANYSSKT